MTQSSEQIIVAKFGGTSMASAAAIKHVADIIEDQNIQFSVVSAVAGSTNILEDLGNNVTEQAWKVSEQSIADLANIHLGIARELCLEKDDIARLKILFDEATTLVKGMYLLKDNPPAARDRLMSVGERASSLLLQSYLKQSSKKKTELIDARTILVTSEDHGQARPKYQLIKKNTDKKILPKLKEGNHFITQGFIGRSIEGNTTTLGRGGSDFSAAIFAEAMGAKELQIWSDVSGISSCDPRIVKDAKPLSELTYGEAAELALAGAKIIYPATIIPTERANIPVVIKNTFAPTATGTIISSSDDYPPLIRAVAIKNNQHLITVATPRMTAQYGFLAELFSLFQKHKLNIDQVITSETAISMTVSDRIARHSGLMNELREFAEISIEPNIAMVSVVGNNITDTPHVGKRILDAIYDEKEPIVLRGVNQGANKHSFSVFVANKDADTCARRLHKGLINNGLLS